MSDVDPTRDELDSVLRVLAAEGEAQPSMSGGQVRRRGEARGRRRRVVGATAAAVALIAGVAVGVPQILGADEVRRPPAMSPPGPSLSAKTPSPTLVTVDVAKRVLTVSLDGMKTRSIPVVVDGTAGGRMAVVSKSPKRELPGEVFGFGKDYMVNRSWVVELSGSGGSTTYIFETASEAPRSRSVIGVAADDAEWLYKQLKIGDTIAVN
ncbi:L,D-transpeptidase [Streptomyces sp. NBC_01142]|uniref:L,D-transpeptidase n=1 Tax=Streptomyces sp. NBC_01142 TaxID=2975865 RepID=UPI00224F5D52|nr:L,D-transpeptidase [Streptomyces sp. NBC_01142]MCX4818505.1 L,D-transpeptidase [Streptomyces sp. NBC_01142]